MRTLAALIVLLLVAACDTADPITPPPQVMPLEVGTTWTLERSATVRFPVQGGAPDTTARDEAETYQLAIVRDTMIADEAWVRIEPSQGFTHCVFGDAAWFTHRDGDLYRRLDDGTVELAYATRTPAGTPFIDTPEVEAVLADADAAYPLTSGSVRTRRYVRTWRRIELNDRIRGPITPVLLSTDHLSEAEGPVALETGYSRSTGTDGEYTPALIHVYRLVR